MDTSKSGKLEELRKIVAAADQQGWDDPMHVVAWQTFEGWELKRNNGDFISTFSPSLVTRLLDVVEAVKEDVDLAEQWDAVMDGDLDTKDFNREIGRIHDARTKAVKRILESLRALEGSDDE